MINGRLTFLFLLFFLFLFSCDKNIVFDDYQSLDDNIFLQSKPVRFTFNITDTISRNNVFIQLRNNQDYPYSNLFLITKIESPKGIIEIDTLQYEMTNNRGEFLGTGISGIKENVLCVTENCLKKVFFELGEYNLSIKQAMREKGKVEGIEGLEGITDIGLKIEKTN